MKKTKTVAVAITTLTLSIATMALSIWPTNAQPPAGGGAYNKNPLAAKPVDSGQPGNQQSGQNGPPPPPRDCPPGGPGGPCQNGRAVGRELGELLQSLNLTAAQQTAIRATLEADRAEMEQLREQMRRLDEKTRSNVDSSLTAQQRTKLVQLEKELCRKIGDPSGAGGPPPPPPGGRGR